MKPEDVEAALTKETGAVALSQVQYASGFHADVPVQDVVIERAEVA